MKTMEEQIDRHACIGWETAQFLDATVREGIGFRVSAGRWLALWGQWMFDPYRWRISVEFSLTPRAGFGGGLFIHVALLPIWVSFRLGVD